jgi:hypothetical protein
MLFEDLNPTGVVAAYNNVRRFKFMAHAHA